MVVVNNPHVARVLPDSIKEIGKALLYRGYIVEAVLACEDLKEKLIDKIMAQLSEECKHLRSLKFYSLLKKCTPKQLCDFNMDDLALEWQREAPMLHQFLITALCPEYSSDIINLHGWLHSTVNKKYSYVRSSTCCQSSVDAWKCK